MKLPIVQAVLFLLTPTALLAGPYAPPAEQPGSTAVSKDDPEIRYWASDIFLYANGSGVDESWQTPENTLGAAQGTPYNVASLGQFGIIVLEFPQGISNGPGWDFVVFENSFDDYFLELAFVAVSHDGQGAYYFDSVSLTSAAVSAFGQIDATNIYNLAGKYRAGFGVPFDLDDLVGYSTIDLANIRYVLVEDVLGNGSMKDSLGNPIYDPYPTTGSAGFDLDAIGVRYPRALDSVKVEGSEWSYAESIGWYVGARFPWVFHQEHGWWYVTGNDREGLWIWDAALGWLWTKAGLYPTLWSVDREGWIYYDSTAGGTRFLNELSSQTWFEAAVN